MDGLVWGNFNITRSLKMMRDIRAPECLCLGNEFVENIQD